MDAINTRYLRRTPPKSTLPEKSFEGPPQVPLDTPVSELALAACLRGASRPRTGRSKCRPQLAVTLTKWGTSSGERFTRVSPESRSTVWLRVVLKKIQIIP